MMTTYFGRGLNIAAVKIQKDCKLWVQSFFLFHPRREQRRAVVVYSPQRRRARKVFHLRSNNGRVKKMTDNLAYDGTRIKRIACGERG